MMFIRFSCILICLNINPQENLTRFEFVKSFTLVHYNNIYCMFSFRCCKTSELLNFPVKAHSNKKVGENDAEPRPDGSGAAMEPLGR